MDYLTLMLHENRSVIIRTLTLQFHVRFYEEFATDMPSLSTVYRAVKRGNTRKMISWHNINEDPVQQLAYMTDVAHIHEDMLVDIDGMVQTQADFSQRYGWSPRGEECRRTQITIGGRTFAIHAAYTTLGFLPCWKIFEDTVSDVNVGQFVEGLREFLSDDSFGILDNAANQRTDAVRAIINNTFNGRYRYCSPYSPALKPIEHGFSMVKKYIRRFDHMPYNIQNPAELINEAFQYYAVGSAGGLLARHHFDLYQRNHALYVATTNNP